MRTYCDPAFCHFVDAGGNCEDCWNARNKAKHEAESEDTTDHVEA